MLIPVSWLREYVDINVPIEVLAEKLTLAGMEVAHINYIGIPQGFVEGIRWPVSDHLVWDRDKILLGKIVEVKPHPDADRLVLAMVDYGADELEQCVTGAPNLFEYRGTGPLSTPVWAPLALEGAEVWDGHSEEPVRMVLKGKKLRGIYNRSMVCSAKELGISEEHEGIMLLEHDENYVAGTALQDILGDIVLEIELTPNLGHCYSVLGIARESSALLGTELKKPDTNVLAEGASIIGAVELDIREPELNPRFTLALLRNTEVKKSPFWMRYRLQLAGQRPINNFVDVTNYITFEIGQPLHAFDYDKLVKRADGKIPHIITRLPEKGETLTTLDGIQRKLEPHNILVCDEKGVLSLGGVMGGADTEIDASTHTVLLEAASWNFINIRRTGQSQKIFTEAGTRFSRNIHPSRALIGLKRGIELMRRLGGGEIAEGIIDQYPQPAEEITVELPISDVDRLLGMDISIQTAADILSRLQFDVTIDGDKIHAKAPDYRTDINQGIVGRADVIEEIARIYGYDRVPNTIMADEMPEQNALRSFEYEERIRDLLVDLGLNENISYRFTTPEAEALLTAPNLPSSLPAGEYVRMANPIASDKTVLRHSLLTNLLTNAGNNARFSERQQVFEIGKIYLKQAGQKFPDELTRIGILMLGRREPLTWLNQDPELVDFFDLKGLLVELLARLQIHDLTFERANHHTYHPGRSATILLKGQPLATFGELHPKVAENFRLGAYPVMAAELDLELLIENIPEAFDLKALPVTPAILEDIALILAEEIPAADVEALIWKAGGQLLKAVRLFDVYTGAPIPEGHKSLAYRLTYQTDEKTLTDKVVAKVRNKIVASAKAQFNAELRSQ